MGSIRSSIELQDNFTNILMNVINAVNMSVSTMEQMQSVMNEPIDTAAIQGIRDQLTQATLAAQELDAAMQNVEAPDAGVNPVPVILPVEPSPPTDPLVDQPAPVEVPVVWQSDNLDVFTNSGAERFEMEVQSANNVLNTLNQTQAEIAVRAARTNIFPPDMVTDMNGMQSRLQAIQERIQAIESNPLNMGTDTANAELEQLRAQLNQAVQEQELMNRAVEDMDVQAANEAYLRLSQIIGGTERHIRDNVDEQGRFRREIEESTDSAADLKNMIAGAVGAFAGMAGLKKAKDWIDDCTAAFNTQLNAETQLISVLANMLDADYVARFEFNTTADTTGAINDIDAIQNEVNEVLVPVTAESRALTAAFDQITNKAAEIQSRGIYGDEAMIAAAAEFSTYFTDTDAIEMMMDTLSNYAMGMTGGGEIDSTGMVDYATNLGKIMSGSYDAMTKKGFEFTDAQKAIIEGEATREQIVAALGEEYVDMSSDMQAAAAITQVIDEAWAGLYESMSNTPEGKIIQMTNAWGDMKEVIGRQLYPYVLLFVDAITENWGTIQTVLDNITIGLEYMLGFMSWLMEGAINFAQVVIDNWGWISPIIYGIIGALAVYYGWQMAVNAINLISNGIHVAMAIAQMIHAAATGTLTAATAAGIAAQNGLNAAMYACPVTWIVLAVIALVAVIYAACAAVAHFTGVANSGFGVITGGINVAIQFFKNLGLTAANIALGIGNATVALASNMMTAFHNAICSIQSWFYDLLSTALSVIVGICEALNKLPFVEFDYSGITSAADDYAAKAEEAAGNKEGYKSISDAFNDGFNTFDAFQDGWASDAFNAGAAWGDGIAERISDFSIGDLFGRTEIPPVEDYTSGFTDVFDSSGIGSGVDDIAGNTGAMADAMDITGEELKYLRDIAEQEAINRFTTAEINIEQTNHNIIKNGLDLDGIMSDMTDMVNEAIDISTEGVHD